jgi:SPP1 family predicted phage head-tail adaptor
MQAGRLNRRCVLQAPGTAQDELGQPIPGWTDVATVWGDVRLRSGLESVKAGAVVSTVQASVRIRYRTGINAGMRVLVDAVPYEVLAVQPDVGGREYVDLVCQVVN